MVSVGQGRRSGRGGHDGDCTGLGESRAGRSGGLIDGRRGEESRSERDRRQLRYTEEIKRNKRDDKERGEREKTEH